MVITVHNPSTEEFEKAYLTDPVSAGVTTIAVGNTDRFAANQRIMLGEMGREKTEIVTVTAVASDTSLTVGTTQFSHEASDPITVMRFDQVKIYRSTSGVSGTYSILATQDLDVDNEELITTYDDTTGLSTYYYKSTFYHSVSTLESSLSDAISGGGLARNTAGFLIDELIRETNDAIQDRTEVLGWFNEVNDDLITSSKKPYSFLHTRTTLTKTANRNYIDFPTDANGNQTMWKFDRLDYNYTDTSTDPDTDETYTLRIISMEEFRNRFIDNTISSTTVDDRTTLVALDTAVNRLRFNPPFETTAGAAFYLYYWKYFTEIDSEGDTFETPNPRIYKLYALAKHFRKKAASDPAFHQMADRYFADYATEKAKYQRLQNIDAGSPKGFKFLPQITRGNRAY